MTALEPSTGTQDLAEKVARARWERRRVEEGIDLTWEQIGPIFHESHRKDATRWLAAMRAAGLAVVELPPVSITTTSIPLPAKTMHHVRVESPDGKGWEITGMHIPGYNEDDVTIRNAIGWRDLDRARFDAARILAVCDAVERLRAEHQGGESR